MLSCVCHLNMVAHPRNEMETSVSASASLSLSLSLHFHSFTPIPNTANRNTLHLFNSKPLPQQREPFPSPSPPHTTKTPHSIHNHPNETRLIDLHFKRGKIVIARHVFDESPHRDVGSGSRVFHSSMVGNVGHWSACERLEQEMRSMIRLKRFQPGVITVASVLPICAKLKALKQGKEVHAYALKRSFLPQVSIVSSLMVLYSKCGMIEYSIRLFDRMERRNVILWTAMIDSYVENGELYEALGVMRSMQLTEHRPDTVTLARMLCVCGELKLVKLGKEVHGQVLKRGFGSVHYVAAELINMYGTCEVVDKAKLVFSAVPDKGSITWTALIRAYGYKEWYQDAIHLFDHMISNGCSPNHFTFEVVLSVCDKAGFVEDAYRFFNLMSRYKIEASKEHCIIMVRLLTRYGKLDEAQRFLEMSSYL